MPTDLLGWLAVAVVVGALIVQRRHYIRDRRDREEKS